MADSRYSLPKVTKKGAAEAEALNRQQPQFMLSFGNVTVIPGFLVAAQKPA